MITLHHLNNSLSQRILWLFEELGLDYEIVKHQRDSVTRLAPDALKAMRHCSTNCLPICIEKRNGRNAVR